MISRNELLNSKEYWMVKFQQALYEEVAKYLAEHNLTQTEFAEKLGVSKGYVSQILHGDFDHKISKLIEISIAINKAPVIDFETLETASVKKYKSGKEWVQMVAEGNQVKYKKKK